MRISIRLNDQLHREAKRLARKTRRTLTAVIEDAVREVVARRKVAPKVKKTRLITDGGRGLQPGVCLDDNANLCDVMDGRIREL